MPQFTARTVDCQEKACHITNKQLYAHPRQQIYSHQSAVLVLYIEQSALSAAGNALKNYSAGVTTCPSSTGNSAALLKTQVSPVFQCSLFKSRPTAVLWIHYDLCCLERTAMPILLLVLKLKKLNGSPILSRYGPLKTGLALIRPGLQ